MKVKYFLLAITSILLVACSSNSKNNISSFFNPDKLVTQIFSVDINNDTTLVTNSGCIIRLPKGSLQSDNNLVKLEIKEALSNTDIVLAGLTTMSGGQSLSSGGMMYINVAEGYNAALKKEIEILIPSKTYNPNMQVFKGKEKNKSSIDWANPSPLPKDETIIKIDKGERLFKSNCASCHKIETDFTAPALAFITERRPKQWLYAFTRNPMKLIHDGYYTNGTRKDTIVSDSNLEGIIPDFYSSCLSHKWNNIQMTAFPALTDTDLDALYAYIKTKSDNLPKRAAGLINADCCDSCDRYGKAMFDAAKEFRKFNKEEDKFFTLDRTVSIPVPAINDTLLPLPVNTPIPGNERMPEIVSPNTARATYYTINIQAFGWYNIDILMKEYSKCSPSELFIRIQGYYKADLNVVLIIPSVKAFVEGGKLNDGKLYGFYETNGKIPLPHGATCYILTFGEENNKIIFGKQRFIANEKQTIDISLSETSKESMYSQIQKLNLDSVNIYIKKMAPEPVLETTKDFDKKMQEAMKLRPVSCSCGFER